MAEYVRWNATIATKVRESGEVQKKKKMAERFHEAEKSRLNVEIIENRATA